MARVQKIMRVDNEVKVAQKEAVLAVSIATVRTNPYEKCLRDLISVIIGAICGTSGGFRLQAGSSGWAHHDRDQRPWYASLSQMSIYSLELIKPMDRTAIPVHQKEDIQFLEDVIPYTITASQAIAKAEAKKKELAKDSGDQPAVVSGPLVEAFKKTAKTGRGGGSGRGRGGKAKAGATATPVPDADVPMDTSLDVPSQALDGASSTSALTPLTDPPARNASGGPSGTSDEMDAS